MSLRYLVKYQCSKIAVLIGVSEANCYARLSHSNTVFLKQMPEEVKSQPYKFLKHISSTSFGWGKGGNVASTGWQVTLCDSIRHVMRVANCFTPFYRLPNLYDECDESISVGNHRDDVTFFSNVEIVTDSKDAQTGSKGGNAGNSSNDETRSLDPLSRDVRDEHDVSRDEPRAQNQLPQYAHAHTPV